jgi:magnesium chelatase subunit D
MRKSFPFAAIVAQEELKLALMLCALDPSIGGLLIRGDKGTAKSTAARGLAEVLIPLERTPGCSFNCEPEAIHELCEVCVGMPTKFQSTAVPFVNLPLGATEDRVIGSLDFEKALSKGKKAFQPGLLAGAHRGILYIDEVNLLADHLVDVLLDVAAAGTNMIQREGLSIEHPARFTLIGTMNAEEGDLRPQLIDRFGMVIEVHAPTSPTTRAEVVRRRLAYEENTQEFSQQWAEEQEATRKRIAQAKILLPFVTLSESLFNFISQICCELEIRSLRADIVMNKVARGIAALAGRDVVTTEDIRQAAELVLPHRKRRKPSDKPGLDQDKLSELMKNAPPQPPSHGQENGTPPQSDPDQELDQPTDSSNQPTEQTFEAALATNAAQFEVRNSSSHDHQGRRNINVFADRGHYVRSVQDPNPTSLAIDATLRHAVLRNQGELKVARIDFHRKVRMGKSGNLILFLVDASGSMAALARMKAVKGAVIAILGDAYKRRDQVGVISFRGERAELVLAPTRSVELAEQALQELPTGGRTPLTQALELALQMLTSQQKEEAPEPLLVILTDGKSNVAQAQGANSWLETLEAAGSICDLSLPALVVDTEQGFLKFNRASQLAEALHCESVKLDEFTADALAITIMNRLKKSSSRARRNF